MERPFKLVILFAIIYLLCFNSRSGASTYYVATDGNDSDTGEISAPWKTVQKSAATVKAGDTVFIRGGTYQGNLVPTNSGTNGNYITFAAYSGEAVTLTHNPAQDQHVINLRGKSYIVIDGFTLNGNWTGSWVEGYQGGNYNIIRNNTMENCIRTRHGINVTVGTHWKILNNTITHGQPDQVSSQGTDAISLHPSGGYHLVEGNKITNAEHATLLAGGSNIVVRNNYLSNGYNQVANSGSVTGDKKILWENNILVGTTNVPRDLNQAQGIQLNSQQTIIRHNVIYGNYSAGIALECYMSDGEAQDVNGNRVYNNVLFGNHDCGIRVSRFEAGSVMSDNVFKNNVLRKNERSREVLNYQQLYFADFAAGQINIDYVVTNSFFANNNFSAVVSNTTVIGGSSALGSNIVHELSWWQMNYPMNIANNIETDPLFVNESALDFNLQLESPLIDAGAALTETVGSGSGAQVVVVDAKYFSDGWGVVDPDWIKIGSQNPVQIVSIDYNTNTITLASSLSWNNGDRVNLYKDSSGNVVLYGNNPDIGASEYPMKLTIFGIKKPRPPSIDAVIGLLLLSG
jgi:hypothetical protein